MVENGIDDADLTFNCNSQALGKGFSSMKKLSRSTIGQRIRQAAIGLATLLVVCLMAGPGMSLAGVIEDDIGALREDMQEMKKDLAEIKKLLQGALKKEPPAKTSATVGFRGRPTLGQADAPVTIVEFSDYQCPYCKRFSTQVFSQLKRDYIDTGKVRYVFRDFPLKQIHPQAAKAHESAHCAGEQDRYWEMHDVLFQNQKDLSILALSLNAEIIGLDVATFESCLEGGQHAAAIQQDIQDGAKAGVRGTPSFIIGKSRAGDTITGTIVRGAQPFTKFQQVINAVQKPPQAKD